MNPFAYQSAAERYSKGRPHFHDLIVDRIRVVLNIERMLPRALDVACGTGMSTTSLRKIARHVDGVDSSQAMLDQAMAEPGVCYHLASAERIPFADSTFNLITVSSAFHWFDRPAFLKEASRALCDGAHLVVYENAFPGKMQSNSEFAAWQQGFYERFPRTPRDHSPFTDEDAVEFGLSFLAREDYTNPVEFSASDLSLYLSTQTNAIETIERGSSKVEGFRSSIEAEVARFFGDSQRAVFEFRGFVWYLRKT